MFKFTFEEVARMWSILRCVPYQRLTIIHFTKLTKSDNFLITILIYVFNQYSLNMQNLDHNKVSSADK